MKQVTNQVDSCDNTSDPTSDVSPVWRRRTRKRPTLSLASNISSSAREEDDELRKELQDLSETGQWQFSTPASISQKGH